MKTAVVRALGLFASVLVAGSLSAQSTQAVEWKVSEGGNGHWYQGVTFATSNPVSWQAARSLAQSWGGDLVSLTSSGEAGWVYEHVASNSGLWLGDLGPYVGLFQGPNSSEPSGGWVWVDGTPNSGAAAWYWNQPDNYTGCGSENCASYWTGGPWFPAPRNYICDFPDTGLCVESGERIPSALIEWSADCNNDGIVDYGQILRGELEDLNSNGVPDICETSIVSVLPPSVPAQGGSTITIRGNGFPANPMVLIGGVPATNVVRESLTRITATSPAVLPGMASVSVNDFTLADGIYIRPECGSDLDQNGSVDSGDIAIILLDFGPCYSAVSPATPEDSRPFMLREEAAPVGPNAR